MSYLRWVIFVAVIVFFSTPVSAQLLEFQEIATGLNRPVAITHAGDGSGRIFITQQSGQILIYDGTQILPTPFLDISSKVQCCGERGLLSVAFHPEYGQMGSPNKDYFYVYYTATDPYPIIIARYTTSANPNIADPNSELVLKSIPHSQYGNHNGGQLQFSPIDGYLYAGTGDGGGGGDPLGNGQSLNSLLGKILRLDVNITAPHIPSTNPYQNDGNPNTLGEIWSYGLRNPWRFSFDRLTGDILIGDVGQGCYEEVNFRPSTSSGRENYGWNILEGRKCYDPTTCQSPPVCAMGGKISPVIVYSHSLPNVQAVTGGYMYRGSSMPQYYGLYFFADYASGQIWGASPGGSDWAFTELASTGNLISSFGEDETGELYYASLGFGANTGAVYRIQAPPAGPFSDDFSDGDASDWSFSKGTWTVVNQALQGTSNKKGNSYAPYAGCSICTIEADLRIDMPGGRASVLGWYRDKQNYLELILMDDRERIILRQRSGGFVVARKKVQMNVDSGIDYHIKITFNGIAFLLYLDGSGTPLMNMNAGGVAAGTAGFRVKSVTGTDVTCTFDNLDIY